MVRTRFPEVLPTRPAEEPACGPMAGRLPFICRMMGRLMACLLVLGLLATGIGRSAAASETVLHYFPYGAIYEYRWKLLELALEHAASDGQRFRLTPYGEEVTQNRGMILLQEGGIDVIALGTNPEREAKMLPIKIDILRGIVGFRLLVIRRADQPRIAAMAVSELREKLTFGLNKHWADLDIMRANGFSVTTSINYEGLFGMLDAGRFDAFPRGLNEAARELAERQTQYPGLMVEESKALFFPYPVYFWVNKDNGALAARIERGLQAALADGSFRRLFETYHGAEIAALRRQERQVLRIDSPILPAGTPQPDTSWWWLAEQGPRQLR